MLKIDLDTARKFIMGKQGLWPGRRWQGLEGTEQALRAKEYLQLDPLQVVARSHDIELYSRVLDYSSGQWEELAYGQRKFFDWGGWLAVRPMDELPYWRFIMRREPKVDARLRASALEHADAIEEMRAILKDRGTVSNRDFQMSARKRVQSYRGRKDSSLALYYLWRTGEVMIHHRENFERVYALAEAVAPAHLLDERDEAEVGRFLFKKEVSFSGLSRLNRTQDAYFRRLPFDQGKDIVAAMLEEGELVEVQVEGWKFTYCMLGSDLETLEELMAGRTPQAWRPLETNTTEEAVFLAPLDPVSARGRAKLLFDFEYVWEVYKPEHQRKYGYYTLPVLWGERLVARFDSRLDRASRRFTVLGLWLEDSALGRNEAFAEALGRGFARFTAFLGASALDAAGISEPRLKERVCALQNQELQPKG